MAFLFLFQRNPNDSTRRSSIKHTYNDDELYFASETTHSSFRKASREKKGKRNQMKEVKLKYHITIVYTIY